MCDWEPPPLPPTGQDPQSTSSPILGSADPATSSCSPSSGQEPAAVAVGHRPLLELEETSLGFPFPGLLSGMEHFLWLP